MTLSKEMLNELFEYKDGELYRIKSLRTDLLGTKAGSPHYKGYTAVHINGRSYLLHRLIFLMHQGFLPAQVDHIDLDKTNNRIENLRASDASGNRCNVTAAKNNTSGYKNVFWDSTRSKWGVTIAFNNKCVFRKRFDDLELAILVATEVREKYHGAFARHA